MANYFTDIVGGTREAFQRGYENVGKIRRDIGENQAARALARGDTEAAKQAYGQAGMVEQVDTLAQRQAQQAEARRKQEADAAEAARKLAIEKENLARQRQSEDMADLKSKLDYIAPIAQQLRYGNLTVQQRNAARDMLIPTMEAMALPNEIRDAFLYSDMTDENLDMFLGAMGMGKPAPVLPKMGSIPQGYMMNAEGTGITPMPGFEPKGTASETSGYGKAPSGYRWTPQGELDIIPGGPADKTTAAETPRLTATEASKAAKTFAALNPLKKAAENFRALISQASPDAIAGFGPEAAKLKSAHRALAMQLKGPAALDLGALIGADFNILNDMIGEPGNPAQFFLEGGKKGALAKLDQINVFFADKEASIKEQYAPYANDPSIARYYNAPVTLTPATERGSYYPTRSGQAPALPPEVSQATPARVQSYEEWARANGVK
jgi:multidrug efflux pump subunit AcrA (membrane-fusion protein)